MKVYLVGGAVRDILLGLTPKDRDYVVVGATPQEMLSLGYQQVGADFPVFLHPVTGEEYALARQERKTGPGYNGFAVSFDSSITLEDDLIRRDLTINSMAMDDDGTIIDPHGGQEDLKNKVLRHTSDAFREDPVRVLRIARFLARYSEFQIATDTREMIIEMVNSGELNSLTMERVFAEFEKGLMESVPSRMFYALESVGVNYLIPLYFSDCERYYCIDEAAKRNLPLDIRFALVANDVSNDMYIKYKIPAELKDLARMVSTHAIDILNYRLLSKEQRLNIFVKCDVFRRKERFYRMMNAIEIIAEAFDQAIDGQIMSDLNNALAVSGAEIAKTIGDVSKIANAIYEARLESIS